jgi:uncharacterized protein (TIGR02246 family)
MTPGDLMRDYEAALATQDWEQVEPVMHPDVCVTFSNGKHFRGRDEVQRAFTENFALIQDEHYEISDIHWVADDSCHAACTYTYRWSGQIGGKPASGAGRGTCLLKNEGDRWLVLAEHLGPLA